MNANLVMFFAYVKSFLAAPPTVTGFDDLSWILNTLYIISFLIGIGIFLLIIILRMMGVDVLGMLKQRVTG